MPGWNEVTEFSDFVYPCNAVECLGGMLVFFEFVYPCNAGYPR